MPESIIISPFGSELVYIGGQFGDIVEIGPINAPPVSSLLTDLISHWKLNEGSGTRSDSYGSNHLTDTNTVASTTGKIDDAASFISANSERLDLAHNASITLGANQDFSIALWVNSVSHGSAANLIHKSLGWIQPELSEYQVYSHFGITRFHVGNGAANAEVSGETLSDGTWMFIIAWYSSADQKVYIQCDNGTPDEAAWTGGTQSSSGAGFSIGGANVGGGHFNGAIDSVTFWKRVLTSQERTDLYNSGNGLDYPF
jgi:hypothetical protein